MPRQGDLVGAERLIVSVAGERRHDQDAGDLHGKLHNTDEHPRHHAVFQDGDRLTLMPVCEICPQPRSTREGSQAMQIDGRERRRQLPLLPLAAANQYLLPREPTLATMKDQIAVNAAKWDAGCGDL